MADEINRLHALTAVNGYRPCILVVEDDPVQRDWIAGSLRPLAQVTSAGTVTEGLAQLECADILILDWTLGDRDAGPVLDEWMMNRAGPCLLVSGTLPHDNLMTLFTRGVYNALEKPVPLDTILCIMRHYIRDVQMQWEIRDAKLAIRENEAATRRNEAATRQLRNVIIALALMLAAVAGPEVLPVIRGVLGV